MEEAVVVAGWVCGGDGAGEEAGEAGRQGEDEGVVLSGVERRFLSISLVRVWGAGYGV